MRPSISRSYTAKSTSLTAAKPPKYLVMCCASRSGPCSTTSNLALKPGRFFFAIETQGGDDLSQAENTSGQEDHEYDQDRTRQDRFDLFAHAQQFGDKRQYHRTDDRT